ncbi:restriction endonuclease subunit S domain-containing protein [Syntrophomonas wolfei]|uniref:restriction endonuclease subunit S n=1 Tax=Syntrophomonas wolfei TaxID=863 RepID=UPI000AB1E712|nr:restriction endonuclease subunit S [Syntrophomonas wolfei]
MRVNNVNFEKLSHERTLRNDYDFHRYQEKHECAYYTFNDLFEYPDSPAVLVDDLYDDFKYCEIGDVDKNGYVAPVHLNFNNRNLLDENYYKKIEKGDIISVDSGDILISKVRPNLKKYVLIDDITKDIYFTSAFIRIKPKKIPNIIYYCLRTIFYENLIAVSRQGKGYPTINIVDLGQLRFNKDIIDRLSSNESYIVPKIKDAENTIKSLSTTTLTTQEIIDSVFQREFSFDYDTFEELKTHKNYTSRQSLFSNNPDLRFSVKYHRPAGDFVMKQLSEMTDKKIKHFLAEPIVLGASISPSDFDENGEAYYVSMATIKTLEVELDETQLVSSTYYEAHIAKALQKGDIIVARSGVAIGKTAIVKDDFEGIFADFTMRIRFDNARYNPTFAYYYLRSKYFQYLIEVYKKGLQNQNIFPIVMQEFPIPDILLGEQQRILDEIQDEISKQDEINNQIAELRNQIVDIIMETISE